MGHSSLIPETRGRCPVDPVDPQKEKEQKQEGWLWAKETQPGSRFSQLWTQLLGVRAKSEPRWLLCGEQVWLPHPVSTLCAPPRSSSPAFPSYSEHSYKGWISTSHRDRNQSLILGAGSPAGVMDLLWGKRLNFGKTSSTNLQEGPVLLSASVGGR